MSVQDARFLKQQAEEEREREEAKRRAVSGGGRVDVEPSIDTSHLASLEREQQRAQLAKVTPKTRAQEPPTTTAFRQASKARKEATQTEKEIQEQAVIIAETISDAENQIKTLESNPGGYTINDKPVTTAVINGLKQKLKEYRQSATSYLKTGTQQVGEQREYANDTMKAIGEWSTKVRTRNDRSENQTRQFNQQLATNRGFGTKTDQEQTRFDGMLRARGVLPGPGAGPAPGSLGEKIALRFGVPASRKVKGAFTQIERPFTAVTQPTRALAGKLIEESKKDIDTPMALAQWTGGVALNVLAGGIDVASGPYRPGFIIKQIKAVGALATDSETRKATFDAIRAEPFRFGVETLGSASLGAGITRAVSDFGSNIGPVSRAIKGEIGPALTPHKPGLFAPGTKPTFSPFRLYKSIRGVSGRKYVDVNPLLGFERELYEFPSEVLEGSVLQTFRPESAFEVDTTFNAKFGKIGDSSIGDPSTFTSDMGITPTKGSLKTPFSKTFGRSGAELVPMLVPEGVANPTTLFRFRQELLTIPSGAPSLVSTVPRSFRKIIEESLTQIGVASTLGIKFGSKQRTPQVQKPGTATQTAQKFDQMLKDSSALTPPDVFSISAQRIQSAQKVRQTPITIQKLSLPQLQSPDLLQKGKGYAPFLLPPSFNIRKTPIIPFEKKKSRKKPKKPGSFMDIIEKRKDPLGALKVSSGVLNFNPLGKKKRKKKKKKRKK